MHPSAVKYQRHVFADLDARTLGARDRDPYLSIPEVVRGEGYH